LVTKPVQAWLVVQDLDPTRRAWIAVVPQDSPTPLRLETPAGVVAIEECRMGRIEWRAPHGEPGTLIIEAMNRPVGLQVPDGVAVVFSEPG
jgi:hypothetical protein